MLSLARYRTAFSSAPLRRTFLISIIGRLPIGVTGLAILVLVQSATGSFARGGFAAGCYVSGLALAAPGLGRMIDRHGPRAVLRFCALAFPSALAFLIYGSEAAVPWLEIAAAAAAGASFPPITVCMRTYMRRALTDEALLSAAFSAESVLIEVIFIIGPLVVAVFAATAAPALAVWFSAGCALVGTLVFLRSPALQGWRIERRSATGLLGPLARRDFAHLVGIVLCFATAFGFLEIGITAYAVATSDAALAGVLLGLMSAGSALGGLAYGSRAMARAARAPVRGGTRRAGRRARRARGALATLGVCGLVAISRVAIAPALIIQSMLVTKTAATEHSTEAFTWTTSALLAGVGIGLAFGGILLERLPWSAAFVAGAAAALLSAAGARVFLRR